MLLTSSILTYCSTISYKGHSIRLLRQVTRWLSIFLRRLAKLIAGYNAIWIVVIGIFHFSGFYDRCFCNSNIMGVGKEAAHVIISLVSVDMGSMLAAQIGGFFLAAVVATIFVVFVALFIDPPLPP